MASSGSEVAVACGSCPASAAYGDAVFGKRDAFRCYVYSQNDKDEHDRDHDPVQPSPQPNSERTGRDQVDESLESTADDDYGLRHVDWGLARTVLRRALAAGWGGVVPFQATRTG